MITHEQWKAHRDKMEADLRAELSNAIQSAIEAEARLWGEESFYSPSPGQLWSHVAHRITQVVLRVDGIEDAYLEEFGG